MSKVFRRLSMPDETAEISVRKFRLRISAAILNIFSRMKTSRTNRKPPPCRKPEIDWRISQETVLRGVADGDTQLQPESRSKSAGIAEGFNGEYILTSVNHTIDAEKGFISEISTVLPKPRPRRKNSLATYGIVTAVNDPENLVGCASNFQISTMSKPTGCRF